MPNINRRELAKALTAGAAMAATSSAAAWQPVVPRKSGVASIAWSAVAPGIWRARIGTPEVHTPVSLRLIPSATESLGKLPTVSAPSIGPIEGTLSSRGCRISVPLKGGEQVYGFGLQLLSFQQRSRKRTIRVNADPKGDSGDSHAPVPFYVTTEGYGLLFDTLRHADIYCGDARPKPTRPTGDPSSAVNTPENTQERNRQESGQVLIEVPRAPGIDVYLFAGPSMLQAVQRYNLYSGGGVAPPEWGLGFWYRVEQHADHNAVLAMGKEFRDRQIPCDVLGLEPGWQTHAYSCTFAWNLARFPDPTAFIAAADKSNFKINLWEHAFTHPSSPLFEGLRQHAGDFAVWEGLVPDFAGKEASTVFGDYHGKNLIDAGISGFKLDECDGSDYTGGWSFPDLSKFPSGLDGEQMHAVFGLRYQHAIWQQFVDRKRPTYNLVRSSGALAAPYPFVLYSDLYEHRQFVRGVATSGFSGLLWCPEVRDAVSEEDLIRRLQSVVFSPLAMVNAWYIKNPPWKQLDRKRNNADDLLDNWQALEDRCREIIGWRMQLIPYLSAAFAQYALDGTPPFRALVLDHPGQTNLHTVDDQYLIGDRMLVAPLFAGEPGREVIFPDGEWHDFWTGQPVLSGANLHISADTKSIPVFVKAGSVIPLASVGASSNTPQSRELTVRIFGDGHLPFRIHSPAGVRLEITWDEAHKAGNIEQRKTEDKPYRIIKWTQSWTPPA